MTGRKHFILAIDGGGVRGLVPLRVLESLETRMRARGKSGPLHRYFDLMAGTSTGGLIVAGLSAPKPDDMSGAPAATVEELRGFFEVEAREVFHRRRLLERLVTNPLTLFDQRYDERPLEGLLKARFGWTSIASALTHVVLTAYDMEAREAVFMTNGRQSDGSRPDDFYFWQAVRATTAAPVYFEPAKVENLTRGTDQVLVDGGVFLNNPVLAAYVEGRKLGWRPEDMVILSLGTGARRHRGYSYEEAAGWGALGWLSPANDTPLLSVLSHGQATTAAYQADWLLPEAGVGEVIRLDGELPRAAEAIDNTRPGNIIELNGVADRIIRDNTELLDRLAGEISERSDWTAGGLSQHG
ncbi:patatin-like phospholipase family protein [Stappia taiwanensis]|uniref:Patatin-like phospholipase family protein n=1 Tax=Stappia taiwanensis TaxID=992267 RepID=A0A838XSW1_9HYPH|nr:patatin-like phospholipase family protein [Stappia taiwanensis]MBA4612827.1 patatin-like phospholipase family protein [Stappia taiwanensis]GGE89709.1 patatin [Stappia taiwanensis]